MKRRVTLFLIVLAVLSLGWWTSSSFRNPIQVGMTRQEVEQAMASAITSEMPS